MLNQCVSEYGYPTPVQRIAIIKTISTEKEEIGLLCSVNQKPDTMGQTNN